MLGFDDAVRRRPAMYFRVARDDPGLATQVLCTLLQHAFHPGAKVAADHTPQVSVEIFADLAFSVTDDQTDALTDHDTPCSGYYGSLLTTSRWGHAAAAALSARTTVEVWRNGRGFRQQLVGLRPIGPPVEFPAPPGSGTHVTYVLDASYFHPAATITTDLARLDVHGLYCNDSAGPGQVVIRDFRDRHNPIEHHHH